MKVGMRKPSIKKSFKARTTSQYKRAIKRSINPFYGKRGMGFIRNPRKSIYNKIYHKTTFGLKDLIYLPKKSSNKNSVKNNSDENDYGLNWKELVTNEEKEYLKLYKDSIMKMSDEFFNGYKISLDKISHVEIENKIIYIYDLEGNLFFHGNLTEKNQKNCYKLYKKVNKKNLYPYKSYYEVTNNLPEGKSKRPLKIFKFVNLPLSILLILLSQIINSPSFSTISIIFLAINIYCIRVHTSSLK